MVKTNWKNTKEEYKKTKKIESEIEWIGLKVIIKIIIITGS